MSKVFELEGRMVTVHFKQIEINGNQVLTPGLIEVTDLPYQAVPAPSLEVLTPQTRPQALEHTS